jgi:hypothetical protein
MIIDIGNVYMLVTQVPMDKLLQHVNSRKVSPYTYGKK